jgi:hypothetical protein
MVKLTRKNAEIQENYVDVDKLKVHIWAAFFSVAPFP